MRPKPETKHKRKRSPPWAAINVTEEDLDIMEGGYSFVRCVTCRHFHQGNQAECISAHLSEWEWPKGSSPHQLDLGNCPVCKKPIPQFAKKFCSRLCSAKRSSSSRNNAGKHSGLDGKNMLSTSILAEYGEKIRKQAEEFAPKQEIVGPGEVAR